MTQKEIAELAGVSVATVSYVLNGSKKVGIETKKKIERIMQETGYRSNILAQSLRKDKTGLIGIIVEDITVWHSAFIIDGINAFAEENGYQTILGNLRMLSKIESRFEDITKYREDIDNTINTLLGMQVDGMIYVGMHDRLISNIMGNANKPVVYCYCSSTEGSSVRYNNERAAYQLTKNFLAKGHRDFGVVMGIRSSEPTRLRFIGIRAALDELRSEERRVGKEC